MYVEKRKRKEKHKKTKKEKIDVLRENFGHIRFSKCKNTLNSPDFNPNKH